MYSHKNRYQITDLKNNLEYTPRQPIMDFDLSKIQKKQDIMTANIYLCENEIIL